MLWEELASIPLIKDFQRPVSNDGLLTRISMDRVVAITLENVSDYTMHLENQQAKTYTISRQKSESVTLVSPLGCPFLGDLWVHFANDDRSAASGSAKVILFKIPDKSIADKQGEVFLFRPRGEYEKVIELSKS